eukprot:jgi/Chlat1/6916/Chrsp52S00516
MAEAEVLVFDDKDDEGHADYEHDYERGYRGGDPSSSGSDHSWGGAIPELADIRRAVSLLSDDSADIRAAGAKALTPVLEGFHPADVAYNLMWPEIVSALTRGLADTETRVADFALRYHLALFDELLLSSPRQACDIVGSLIIRSTASVIEAGVGRDDAFDQYPLNSDVLREFRLLDHFLRGIARHLHYLPECQQAALMAMLTSLMRLCIDGAYMAIVDPTATWLKLWCIEVPVRTRFINHLHKAGVLDAIYSHCCSTSSWISDPATDIQLMWWISVACQAIATNAGTALSSISTSEVLSAAIGVVTAAVTADIGSVYCNGVLPAAADGLVRVAEACECRLDINHIAQLVEALHTVPQEASDAVWVRYLALGDILLAFSNNVASRHLLCAPFNSASSSDDVTTAVDAISTFCIRGLAAVASQSWPCGILKQYLRLISRLALYPSAGDILADKSGIVEAISQAFAHRMDIERELADVLVAFAGSKRGLAAVEKTNDIASRHLSQRLCEQYRSAVVQSVDFRETAQALVAAVHSDIASKALIEAGLLKEMCYKVQDLLNEDYLVEALASNCDIEYPFLAQLHLIETLLKSPHLISAATSFSSLDNKALSSPVRDSTEISDVWQLITSLALPMTAEQRRSLPQFIEAHHVGLRLLRALLSATTQARKLLDERWRVRVSLAELQNINGAVIDANSLLRQEMLDMVSKQM